MAELDKLAGWERTRAVYRLYPLAMPLIWILIGVVIGAFLFGRDGDTGYATNLYTEILSISVTVFVLDYLNRQRDKESRIQALKEQLVRDASSTSNEIAKNAIHQLRKQEWLVGDNGLLKLVDLEGANLESANLECANLVGANLRDANLESANLVGANLESANLRDANLQGSNLRGTNLQGARLIEANLQEVNLGGANLESANLKNANLVGANLVDTKFDESTILPDGTKWTPDTDMGRFTDPNHPDFPRSVNPYGSAFRHLWG